MGQNINHMRPLLDIDLPRCWWSFAHNLPHWPDGLEDGKYMEWMYLIINRIQGLGHGSPSEFGGEGEPRLTWVGAFS